MAANEEREGGLLGQLTELEEIAARLQVTPKTLRNRIARGVFPRGRKLPGSRGMYYTRAEIDRWLSENLVG